MQLHAYILNLGHDLLNEVFVLLLLLDLEGSQLDSHYHLLEDVVVEVMLSSYFLPFIKHFLKLEVHSESFCVYLVQSRQEVFAKVFVVFVQRFEGQDTWDYQKNICVRALDHFFEFLILLRNRFNCARKMKQMTFLFTVTKIVSSFLPRFLVFHQSLYQIRIVL